MRTLAFAVLCVTACGRIGFDEIEPEGSGTRLKLHRYAFESTLFTTGYYDTVLASDCYARQMADGLLYCAPIANPVLHAFFDPSCTQPVWVISAPCEPPRYVADYPPTCASAPTIAQLGARVVAPTVYLKDSMGMCTGIDVSTNQVYEPGPPLDPARDMVRLEEIVSPATARLQRVTFASADGFRAPAPYVDQMLGVRCYASHERLSGDATACEPTSGAPIAQYYSDAVCTQPKLSVNASCPAPAFMVPTDQCRPGTYYSALPTTEQPLYAGQGSCGPASQAGQQFFDLGPPVALAPMTVTPDTRERIASYQVDGLVLALRDQLLDVECLPGTAADGAAYCVPSMMSIATMFRDAGCTQPAELALLGVDPSCPSTRPIPRYARMQNSCTALEDVRAVGIEITTPVYDNTNGCMPYPSIAKFYELGAAVPRSEFAQAVDRFD